MELFTRLFGNLLVLVYHCFDRIVIHGYLSGLSRPEQVVHFVRQVHGIPVVSKEVLSQRTHDYQTWVEAFARNHQIPMEWADLDPGTQVLPKGTGTNEPVAFLRHRANRILPQFRFQTSFPDPQALRAKL